MENGASRGLTARQVREMLRDAQVGAYGAQAAFFVLLSAVPFLVVLAALLRALPWEAEEVYALLPDRVGQTVRTLLPDESPSAALLSLSAGTALWSASRGVLALTRGLNRMYGREERRGYVSLRFFCLAVTLILEISLLCTLGGMLTLAHLFPISGTVAGAVGTVAGWGLLSLLFLFLYTLLPDRATAPIRQLPGAMAAALGWILFTEGFTLYATVFADFPRLYGDLSRLATGMLWLWLCLCILFLGAFVNRVLSLL